MIVDRLKHLSRIPCSREGAGLGEAIAYLVEIAIATTLVVLLIAVISGFVVGLQRGSVGKQVLKHLGWALLVLIALPPLSYATWLVHDAIVRAQVERTEADYARWLQPFAELKPGGLGAALDRVLTGEGAGPGRAAYLVLSLQQDFDAITFAPTDGDRAVLAHLPERMTHELDSRNEHTHPSNIQNLKGAANWLRLRPDLEKAAVACDGNDYCLGRLADSWWKSCYRDMPRCRTETPEATLDTLAAHYSDHYHFRSTLLGARERFSQLLPPNSPGE